MERIGKFFERLGFPLRNSRWSWGAHSALGVLLRTWTDDLDPDGQYVRVLGWKSEVTSNASSGRVERLDHLRALWSGGLPGYVVIATAKDVDARTRTILSYDDKVVRAIVTLDVRPDGSIWAELGDAVPTTRLRKHAATYRLASAVGPFPIERQAPKRKPKQTTAAYVSKIPAMRRWLIDLARKRRTATYEEARAPFGIRPFEHRHAMDRIGHTCLDAGEPILTSLIVDKVTGQCSSGFFKEFRRDDALEREDCYAFWAGNSSAGNSVDAEDAVAGARDGGNEGPGSLRVRAARFSKVAVRPEQAPFRRRVFLACGGACVVTGCEIPEVLDAAHRKGRDWKCGHNLASDGLLLRKDIHALYDAGLIHIDANREVILDPKIAAYYGAIVSKR